MLINCKFQVINKYYEIYKYYVIYKYCVINKYYTIKIYYVINEIWHRNDHVESSIAPFLHDEFVWRDHWVSTSQQRTEYQLS